MVKNMRKDALGLAILAGLAAESVEAQVFVNQAAGPASDPAFVRQVPQGARPVPSRSSPSEAPAERTRAAVQREFIIGRPDRDASGDNAARSLSVAGESDIDEETARRRAVTQAQQRLPSIGSGTRAVINTDVPPELPSVGSGTVRN